MAKTNRKFYQTKLQTGKNMSTDTEQNAESGQVATLDDTEAQAAAETTVIDEQAVVIETQPEEATAMAAPGEEVISDLKDVVADEASKVNADVQDVADVVQPTNYGQEETAVAVTVEEVPQQNAEGVDTEEIVPAVAAVESVSEVLVDETSETVVEVEEVKVENQPVSPTPVQEVKPLIEVNLDEVTPTQEDVVKSIQAIVHEAPVDTIGLIPEVRAEVIQSTDSLINSAISNADVMTVSVLENLRNFVNEMDPLKPLDERKAGSLHVNLYRALKGGIENVETNFNVFFGTILAVFKEHAGTVFHEKYLLRGYINANFNGGEANRYVTLLQTFKTLADPQTRSMNVKQVNFTKAFEGFNERAQQKLRAFFNV